MPDDKKENSIELTHWDKIKHLSLPNQVKALCLCLDDIKKPKPVREES